MCLDPNTLFMIGSTVLTMGGQIAQGAGAKNLGKDQARAYLRQGREARLAAIEQEARLRRENKAVMARQRLDFLHSGVDPGSGSAAEVAKYDARLAELDALTVRYGGEVQEAAYRDEASFALKEGKAGQKASFLNAGATLLSSASTWDAFRRRAPA